MTVQEVRKMWVEALRSGDYKQGTRYLHTGSGGFCCLGVLCDLAVKEGVIPPPTKKATNADIYCYEDGENSAVILGPKTQEWVGLFQEGGAYSGDRMLAKQNDDGYSFEDIADIIESQPEGLFV